MPKPFIIALSGASHSGKTTFARTIQHLIGEDYCEFHDEIIRNKTTNIDEIRKTPKEYLKIQFEIIRDKILQENKAFNSEESKIIFFDRSLVDSLYYYIFYVDKSDLSKEDMVKYSEFLEFLTMQCSIVMSEFKSSYDSIIIFPPIELANDRDKMRPQDLKIKQKNEFDLISRLSRGYNTSKNKLRYIPLNSSNIIKEYPISTLMSAIKSDINIGDYKTYKALIEEKYFVLDNIITNTYGSIEASLTIDGGESTIIPLMFDVPLVSSCLFSTDKNASDSIINQIKQIDVEKEFMNSRCHPCGLFSKNNSVIVGEAPGTKGRSINDTFLKPSFIFTQTSYYLRKAIVDNFNVCPYITNLLKYARKENKVTYDDFDKCFSIFEKEMKAIQPEIIYVLGQNPYKYLLSKGFDKKYKLVYIPHPAWACYKHLSEEDYSRIWKNHIK